jgi:hypothetical protein
MNASIAIITIIPALIQVLLAERLLKRRMRGWLWYTLIGMLLTFIPFSFDSSSAFIGLMKMVLPVALLQTAWLWRRFQGAWLWPLATLVAGALFILSMRIDNSSLPIIVLPGLMYGLVQGAIMRYLWLQPKETEKAKVDALQTTPPIEERAARLQDTSDTSAPWIYGDDQRAQRETR